MRHGTGLPLFDVQKSSPHPRPVVYLIGRCSSSNVASRNCSLFSGPPPHPRDEVSSGNFHQVLRITIAGRGGLFPPLRTTAFLFLFFRFILLTISRRLHNIMFRVFSLHVPGLSPSSAARVYPGYPSVVVLGISPTLFPIPSSSNETFHNCGFHPLF